MRVKRKKKKRKREKSLKKLLVTVHKSLLKGVLVGRRHFPKVGETYPITFLIEVRKPPLKRL